MTMNGKRPPLSGKRRWVVLLAVVGTLALGFWQTGLIEGPALPLCGNVQCSPFSGALRILNLYVFLAAVGVAAIFIWAWRAKEK